MQINSWQERLIPYKMTGLSKEDWLSYKAQHEATVKVRKMQENADRVIMKMIIDELKNFTDVKKKK